LNWSKGQANLEDCGLAKNVLDADRRLSSDYDEFVLCKARRY